MKAAILLLTVFCVSIQAKWRPADDDKLQSVLAYCRKRFQTRLDRQILPFEIPWIEQIPHCRVQCVANNIKVYTDKYGYNASRVVEQLFQDGDKIAFAASVNKCISENRVGDVCNTADMAFKCFVRNNLMKKYEYWLPEN